MDTRTARVILERVREKRAEHTFADAAAALNQGQARGDALKQVLKGLLVGTGGGLAYAGASGLYNMLRRDLSDRRPKPLGPNVLDLPAPAEKAADESWGEAVSNFFRGNHAADAGEVPWRNAAVIGAGGLGFFGARHLLQGQFDAQREREEQRKLEDARGAFEEALAGLPAARGQKRASDAGLGEALDEAYDRLEKSGGVKGFLGSSLNAYGAVAAPLAILAAVAGYRQAAKGSRRAVIDKAVKQRERDRYAQSPPEIFAVPSAPRA